MKRKVNMRRDDRGFTLVELLVSVLILAAVAAPLLHTFVTSASTSARSRRLGDANLAAETIGETIEATHVSKLAAMTVAGQSVEELKKYAMGEDDYVEDDTLEGNAPRYTFSIRGLDFGVSSFDAYVTMTADTYAGINGVLVTEYTPMEAVFAQPAGVYENPDWMAADEFANEALALSGDGEKNSAYFLPKYKRNIEVTIEKNEPEDETEGRAEYVGTAVYKYAYDFVYNVTVVDAAGNTKVEQATYPMSATYSYEFYRSSTADLSSVYLFYYPLYGSRTDEIDIVNEDTDAPELNVFLVKQKAIVRNDDNTVSTMADSAISTADDTYEAFLRVYENSSAVTQRTMIFSNIKANLVTGETRAGTCPLELYRGRGWFRYGTINEYLVEKNAQNRMYEVTIALYEHDADPETDTPVYTLTTSKLD